MNKKQVLGVVVLIILTTILVSGFALAGSSGFAIEWWSFEGGGGTSSGGAFGLGGTIGQPDAGVMQGGEFAISGGFWGGASGGTYTIFLPFIRR